MAPLLFASSRERRTDKDCPFRLLRGFSQTRLSSCLVYPTRSTMTATPAVLLRVRSFPLRRQNVPSPLFPTYADNQLLVTQLCSLPKRNGFEFPVRPFVAIRMDGQVQDEPRRVRRDSMKYLLSLQAGLGGWYSTGQALLLSFRPCICIDSSLNFVIYTCSFIHHPLYNIPFPSSCAQIKYTLDKIITNQDLGTYSTHSCGSRSQIARSNLLISVTEIGITEPLFVSHLVRSSGEVRRTYHALVHHATTSSPTT